MRFITKTIAVLALALASVAPMQAFAANHAQPAQVAADNTKGLFVVITDAEPMTQMMALVLSTQTVQQGKAVRILLCGPAGELAVKGSKQTMFKPIDKSPQMLLGGLMQKGVKVEVCPLYLPNYGKGKSEADLIDGVSVAKPPVVAAAMREDGMKLFTF